MCCFGYRFAAYSRWLLLCSKDFLSVGPEVLEEAGTNYNMTAEESRALVEKRIEDSSEEFSSYSWKTPKNIMICCLRNLKLLARRGQEVSFVRVLVNAMTLIVLHKPVKRQEEVSHGLTFDREGMGAL